jgi:hypothetical protein
MLLTQKAYLEGGRALAYWVALQLDKAAHHPDPAARQDSDDLVALLTPVVKAFATDNGFLCTNLAMQLFGGHGYIQETGMDQYVRDARINMIYEGANFIQSLDLLGRKVLLDNGVKLRKFVALVKSFLDETGASESMAEFAQPLRALADQIEQLTMELGMKLSRTRKKSGPLQLTICVSSAISRMAIFGPEWPTSRLRSRRPMSRFMRPNWQRRASTSAVFFPRPRRLCGAHGPGRAISWL